MKLRDSFKFDLLLEKIKSSVGVKQVQKFLKNNYELADKEFKEIIKQKCKQRYQYYIDIRDKLELEIKI